MRYRVGTFRAAGLQAKWDKTRAANFSVILVRWKDSDQWRAVDKPLWDAIQQRGIVAGLES